MTSGMGIISNFSVLAWIPSVSSEEHRCVSAEVGASKDKTDKVADLTMQVIPVVELFGRFLKYYVESQTVNSPAPHRPVVNAFQILMDAQRHLQQGKKLPDRTVEKIKR